jgi:hypothetical protein
MIHLLPSTPPHPPVPERLGLCLLAQGGDHGRPPRRPVSGEHPSPGGARPNRRWQPSLVRVRNRRSSAVPPKKLGGSVWPITSFVPFCVWRLPVEADTRYLGGPASGGVALYLAAKRPLDRARERSRPLGHDRSARASAAYATHASMTQTIRTGATVACMLHRGSRINLYPVERPWLVPKSCILVAARLQDGWDSSLVRLIRPTRHPQSHIRPGFGPEAWAELIQLVRQ